MHKSLISVYLVAPFFRKKEGSIMQPGAVCRTRLHALFAFILTSGSSALIIYSSILAYHPITNKDMSFLYKQCNKFDASSDVIYSWLTSPCPFSLIIIIKTCLLSTVQICVPSSFVGKIYSHQRSEHIPGVRFCKYLLVNLLTGRHVCFSYFAFIFSPLPVSITLSNIFTLDSVLTWVIWSVWI